MRPRSTARPVRLALVVAAAATLLVTTAACGSDDDGSDQGSQDKVATESATKGNDTPADGDDPAAATTAGSDDAGSDAASDQSATAGSDTSRGQGADAPDKSGYGQVCGTNDVTLTVSEESQAGGYFLITAKARPGITCALPETYPVVAFGSDGTEADNAEQSVGQSVQLTGSTAAYAGVNPKTTNTDGGKELSELIVAVRREDSDPVSLPVSTFVVDRPIVTNWHTSAADAVPGDGTDG